MLSSFVKVRCRAGIAAETALAPCSALYSSYASRFGKNLATSGVSSLGS